MPRVVVSFLVGLLFLCLYSGIGQYGCGQELESVVYVNFTNMQGPWDGTFQHPFRYIQEGIDAVGENGTVNVAEGLYPENITILKSIRLIGENTSRTIIKGEGQGVVVYLGARNMMVKGLTIRDGRIGIFVVNSSGSTITGNTIRNSTLFGVYISSSSHENLIYRNSFLENAIHAYDGGMNQWDNGSVMAGNYWDDYHYGDANNDGVGDVVYLILGGTSRDRSPLIVPPTLIPPLARFLYTPVNPTTQDVLQFTDASIDVDDVIVLWSWDFGDNNYSVDPSPMHRYLDDGVYQVRLTVTDEYGTTHTSIQQILVSNVEPIAAFVYSPLTPTDLSEIVFNDTSYDFDGVVVSWMWDFGDNNTSAFRNVTHRYRDNGTYQITLNVTDDDGARHFIMKHINVSNVAPAAGFSFAPTSPTTKDLIQFTDTSVDGDGLIVSWFWIFGDGDTSTQQSPSHNYSKADEYTVFLTVVDNDGASSVKQVSLPVHSTGSASFGNEFNFIFILYIVLFVIMIGVVLFLVKKYR